MSGHKGVRPPNAGIGRKKGVPNKLSKTIKEMILGALSDVGGQEYLAKKAKSHPVAFLALIGRVIPTEIKGDLRVTLEDLVAGRGGHDSD